MSELLEQQNRMIISLLARRVIGVEQIRTIVEGSKKPEKRKDYIRAYNALDGSRSITEIAKIAKVYESTMREILKDWENKGIVYRAEKGHGGKYLGLLNVPLRQKSTKNKTERN